MFVVVWIKENYTHVLGGLLISIIFILFLTIIFKDSFFGLYSRLGLAYYLEDATGIYADCSNSKNRNNRFCNKDMLPQYQRSESKRISQEKSTLPFGLNR